MKRAIYLVLFISLVADSYSQDTTYYAKKGRQALIDKKYKEAIKFLDTAISMGASSLEVYYNRGVAKGMLEEFLEAL